MTIAILGNRITKAIERGVKSPNLVSANVSENGNRITHAFRNNKTKDIILKEYTLAKDGTAYTDIFSYKGAGNWIRKEAPLESLNASLRNLILPNKRTSMIHENNMPKTMLASKDGKTSLYYGDNNGKWKFDGISLDSKNSQRTS